MSTYEYWQRALELTGGKRSLTRDEMKALGLVDEPCLGFFRKRIARGGAYAPVAIWEHDGKIFALVDQRICDAGEVWSYAAPHPVTEEAYRAKVDGGVWPDEDTNVTASLEIGANNPPQDEADILKEQIDAASANAAIYAEISDDETACRAQSARSRLLELSRTADKRREELKKPILEAGKSLDARWQPLVKAAKAAADAIAKALGDHETRKAKAAAAAAEAERKRLDDLRKAEEAAQRAEGPPRPALAPVEPPAPTPAPSVVIKGAYGRAAAVKVVKVAKVTDQNALYPFLATHPELIDLMAKLAQRAVTAGLTPPGVEIEEVRKVA